MNCDRLKGGSEKPGERSRNSIINCRLVSGFEDKIIGKAGFHHITSMNLHNRIFSTTILSGLLLISPAIEIIHKQSPIVQAQTTEELNAEADRLLNEGFQLFKEGTAESLQQAIEKFKQALPLYQQLEDKSKEALIHLALGRVHNDLGFKPVALDCYNQALPLVRLLGDISGEASTLNNIGTVYDRLGEKQTALDYFNQALPLVRQAGDISMEATTLNNIGTVYDRLGEKQTALDYFNQALPLLRQAGNISVEATTLNNIGQVYSDLGDKQTALDYFNQALPRSRQAGNISVEAKTRNNIGQVYSDLGDKQRALDYFNEALPLLREVGDMSGVATSLNNIGLVYSDLGEKQTALDYYNQALPLRREVEDISGEAATLNNIGQVYSDLGDKQRALDYYNQGLPLLRQVEDISGEATTLNNIGLVYSDLGEKQTALDYFNQALPLRREVGDISGEAATLNNIGAVYDRLADKQTALDYYNQALPLRREVEDISGEATTLNNIGAVYDRLGEKQTALDYYNQALPLLRLVGNISVEVTTLFNIASVERDRGDLTEALSQINAAIEIIEALRSKIINPDLRQSYFATVQGYYQLKIDLLMQLHQQDPDRGYDAVALHTCENSRARVLAELLTEANLNIRLGVDRDLLAEEKRLERQLSAVEKQRQVLVSGSHTSSDLDQLITERDNILKQLSDVETKIRQDSPAYANLKYPSPITLEKIQATLEENTLLLEYALGKDNSYLFLVGKNSFSTYQLPPRAEIDAAVDEYLQLLKSPIQTDVTPGEKLSDILLSPIANQLNKQQLIIVSNGKLQLLPFAALPIPDRVGVSTVGVSTGALPLHSDGVGVSTAIVGVSTGAVPLHPDRVGVSTGALPLHSDGVGVSTGALPLLVNHEIISLPSFTSLIVQKEEWQKRPAAPKTFAVLADPVFGPKDPRLSGIVADNNQDLSEVEGLRQGCTNLERLYYTEKEVNNILAQVPDDQEFSALGFDATREAAISPNLQDYQIVHFATHGCIHENPLLSGLAFSSYDEQGNRQDSFLRLQDIFNLQLNAELVVLSACETGLGDNVSGEGIVGLTRGFMYAGARRVLVSLWAVNDPATAELMENYYQKMLQDNLTPVAALRAAQLEMWQGDTWQSPYYWAAFTIQGDW